MERSRGNRSARSWTSAVLALGVCSAGAGCGGDDEGPHEEDPSEHACEHAAIAGAAVNAGAARDDAAGEIVLGHEPYTATLVPGAPGYVRFEVPGAIAALLFAGTADVVQRLFHGDEAEDLPAPAPNDHCADEIPEHFDLDLHEAGTYFVEVGPAATPDVWLMLTAAEGHAHE